MKPRTALLIFLLIISVWLTLLSATFSRTAFPAGADEYWYFNYTSAIGGEGLKAVPVLFKDYCSNSSAWKYPNPFRIGYFALGSLWLKLTGLKYINLAYFSLFSYLLTLIVSYIFCNRYLGRQVALVASALLAFSPLGMALSRRVLADTASNLFIILSLILFFEYTHKKKYRFLFSFCAAYFISLLVKETAAIFILFFLIWIVYDEFAAKTYFKGKSVYFGLAGLIIPFAVALLVFVSLGVFPYLGQLAAIIIKSPGQNPYAQLFGRGPWFRYLVDYLLLSPVVFILALLFIGKRIFGACKKDALISYALTCCVFTFLLFNLFTKNVRYVLLLDWFLRIFAAIIICDTVSKAKIFKRGLLLAAVILLILYDYSIFNRLFLAGGIYDPVSFNLLKPWNFIP